LGWAHFFFLFFLFPRASPPAIFPYRAPSTLTPLPCPHAAQPGAAIPGTCHRPDPPPSRASPHCLAATHCPPPLQLLTPPPALSLLNLKLSRRSPPSFSFFPCEPTAPEASHRLPLHHSLPTRPPPLSERRPSPEIWPHRRLETKY
jgi:hypothetical protein